MKPALVRDRARIHSGHAVEAARERPGEDRAADDAFVGADERAVVADAYFVRPFRDQLTDHRAEPVREIEKRPQLRDVVWRHGGEVDRVADDAVLEVVADLDGRFVANELLPFDR